MRRILSPIVVLSLLAAGGLAMRDAQTGPIVSPAERQTLRDAANDTDPNGALPSLPKLKIAGVRGSDWDIPEERREARHVVNATGFAGVYMTRSRQVSGFVDVLTDKDGFCEGDMVSFRTRAMDGDGKPIVFGTCLARPENGTMHYDHDGCAFRVSLMRDARTGQALIYLNVLSGSCKDVGTGHADLSAMHGVGFWMLP